MSLPCPLSAGLITLTQDRQLSVHLRAPGNGGGVIQGDETQKGPSSGTCGPSSVCKASFLPIYIFYYKFTAVVKIKLEIHSSLGRHKE